MMMRLLVAAALAASLVHARVGDVPQQKQEHNHHYPLVERRRAAQTMKLTLDQLKSLQLLSWSEDSAPKQIDNTFYLNLFETDGDLPMVPSMVSIQEGINTFLRTELNAVYDKHHQVQSVNAVVVTQAAAASSRRRRRQLAAVVTTGSQLETQVEVTFANEPSPDATDLQAKVLAVFQKGDLAPLLANITNSRVVGDAELANINAIYFLGNIAPAPTQSPTVDRGAGTTVGAITDRGTPRSVESKIRWEVLIPVLLAGFVVIVLVALFSSRRSRRRRYPASRMISGGSGSSNHRRVALMQQPHDGRGTVNLYWDTDDIFSVEAALIDNSGSTEPHSSTKEPKSTSNKATTADDQSDIFSGIGAVSTSAGGDYSSSLRDGGLFDSESPRGGDSRSVFSFLSGFASKASTVVASNVTPLHHNSSSQKGSSSALAAGGGEGGGANNTAANNNNNGATTSDGKSSSYTGTPHSRVSSLFTFSEEDSQDLLSSGDERGLSPKSAVSPSQEQQDIGIPLAPSDEEQGTPSSPETSLATMAVGTVMDGVCAANTKDNDNGAKDADNGAKDANNVSHVFDNESSTTKSLGSPNASLNDSMFAAADLVPTTLAATSTTDDTHSTWCKDSCAITAETKDKCPDILNPSSSDGVCYFVATESDSNKHKTKPAKLSTEEITKELMVAEAESKKLKKMSTNWSMSMFGNNNLVESPAAASYNPKRPSLSSPHSQGSMKSDPGPNAAPVKPNGPNLIQLQWDDPKQAAANRAKAAAFVGSVAETTTFSSGVQSENERLRQLAIAAQTTPTKGRMSTNSAGNADGTDIYQIDTAEQGSIESSKGSLSFRRGRGTPMSLEGKVQFSAGKKFAKPIIETIHSDESPSGLERVRRHAKSTSGDGTTNYQHETMGDWSVEEEHDDPSITDSDNGKSRKRRMKINLSQLAFGSKKPPKSPGQSPGDAAFTPKPGDTAVTPKSAVTNNSSISGLSAYSPSANSEASPSKQLISDLLWLEQKIAATNQAVASPSSQKDNAQAEDPDNRIIGQADSLSFASGDGIVTTGDVDSSLERSGGDRDMSSKDDSSLHQSIVCRDCYAPPGKLKIVIHSTKDGPAVHTVKKGSTLEGRIFPGDLIISVDNVDTRSYSAEQVMKMMTAKTRFERKITVLHFEAESGGDSSN